jgi:hypothetical protein
MDEDADRTLLRKQMAGVLYGAIEEVFPSQTRDFPSALISPNICTASFRLV